MVRMILHGCNGRMGKMIADIVKEDGDIEIAEGVDINTAAADFPVVDSIDKDSFFDVIKSDGILPRTTFSMGCACDKRFYLECRRIR